MRHFIFVALCAACSLVTLAASEPPDPQATGLRDDTPEERTWLDRHLIIADQVSANRLAWDRLQAERAVRGLAKPVQVPPLAEVGKEVSGSTRDGSQKTAVETQSVALPLVVDNSLERWFPPVRSQGSLDSCVAFSQAYYGMTYMVNRALDRDGRSSTDNSTKMSPRFVYNIGNGGRDSGMGSIGGLSVMQRYGTVTWADVPYTSDWKSLPTTGNLWRSALGHRVSSFGAILGIDTPGGRDRAKQLLANGNLLYFTTLINGWKFTTLKNNPASTADDAVVGRKVAWYLGSGGGGHAMVIVGYNDEVWTDINGNNQVDPGELGAFKVVNSWGTGWGNSGFAYVAYDALASGSQVTGANQPGRAGSIFMGTYWALLRQNSAATLIAEIDLTTASRNDLNLTWGVTNTSGTTVPMVGAESFSIGGAFSFDGQTSARDATLAFDWSGLATTGSLRRYILHGRDGTRAGAHVIRGFRLYDGSGNLLGSASATSPSGGLPITADHSANRASVYTWIDRAVPDLAPPAAINDVAVVGRAPTSISLAFSATGDDGTVGLTTSYEIRYATSAISSSTVSSAAVYVPYFGRPPAGTAQTATVPNLIPGTTYWFVVRAFDDAGKVSAISNVVSAATPAVLAAPATSLAGASVGSAYSYQLTASGGTLPRTWALTPRMTETVGSGGTMVAGTKISDTNTSLALPFDFPIQTVTGTLHTRRLFVSDLSMVFSLPPELADLPTQSGMFQWYLLRRQIELGGSGEGIFVDSKPERMIVRWKAHPHGVTGQDGSLEAQATFYPDGRIAYAYRAVNQVGLASHQRGTVGIQQPEMSTNGYATWLSAFHHADSIPAGATSLWTPNRLPPGLSLNPATGRLSGTPTQAGTYTILVTVTDSGNPRQQADQSYTLVVSAGSAVATQPAITSQPAAVSVTLGQAASFAAAASGSPAPTWLWQRQDSGSSTWTTINGATSSTYSFTPVLADHGARFRAVATNSAGTATSGSGLLSVSAPASVTSLKVNFQPASAPAYGDGYVIDAGLVYGDRGAGLSYGWNRDLSGQTRDRNSSLSADQRSDTLIHLQSGSPAGVWELAIANGSYRVYAVCGDASATDSVHKLEVEGVLVVNGAPSTSQRWLSGTATVTVSDGRLTVRAASGAVNLKLCELRIEPATATTPPAITAQPANRTVTLGQAASFTVAASGSPAPTWHWQRQNSGSSTWTTISGATTSTLNFTPVLADSGARFRAVATNSAGTSTSAAATLVVNQAFFVNVNFQPASAPEYGNGYVVDGGLVFGNRGGGLSYGWNQNLSGATRDRNHSLSADQRSDTLIHLQQGGTAGVWEIAVPNGEYMVEIRCGDPGYINSVYRVEVEGVLVVSGTPTASNRWVSGSAVVSVSDGRLTLRPAAGASNLKLCDLTISAAPQGDL